MILDHGADPKHEAAYCHELHPGYLRHILCQPIALLWNQNEQQPRESVVFRFPQSVLDPPRDPLEWSFIVCTALLAKARLTFFHHWNPSIILRY
jgi:hypothetical protein